MDGNSNDWLIRVRERLASATEPVTLIGGHLLFDRAFDDQISDSIARYLESDTHGLTICWGPVTYFAVADRRRRNCIYDVVTRYLGHPGLKVFFSGIKQSPAIYFSQNHFVNCRPWERPSVRRHKSNRKELHALETALRDRTALELQTSLEALQSRFRYVEVELDNKGDIQRFLNPSSPKEVLDYLVQNAESLTELEGVRLTPFARCFRHITVEVSRSAGGCGNGFSNALAVKLTGLKDRFPEHSYTFHSSSIVNFNKLVPCDQYLIWRRPVAAKV